MKRLWISSMEDSAIKDGFDKLKDGKDYDNLFESAQARAVADWLVGMNISRLYSCLYKQNYSVGRVQTPTLAMIVKRDDEITNFKKDKYYTVELSMNGFILSTERIDDEVAAEQLINLVGDKIEIKEKKKSIQRIKDVLEATNGRLVPAWLEIDRENLTATVKEIPTRDQIDVPVDEVFIVELYSK